MQKVAEKQGFKQKDRPFESADNEIKCVKYIAAFYIEENKRFEKEKAQYNAKKVAAQKGKNKVEKNSIAKPAPIKTEVNVSGIKFNMEVSSRAAKLIEDELGFLAEDLYDTATYV